MDEQRDSTPAGQDDKTSDPWGEEIDVPEKSKPSIRLTLLWLVLFFMAGIIGYRMLVNNHLEQTSALFIGLPTLLVIILIFSPASKTVTGKIVSGITIALLLSAPLLGEGFICILMAAPLFYAIGIPLGLLEDYSRKKIAERNKLRVIVWLPLAIMSFEGVSDKLSFPRDESVTVTRIVDGTVEQCEQQLAQKPAFPGELPFYLKLGFPKPKETTGTGLEAGSLRTVRFAGGEGKPGVLTMRVAERRPGYVRFAAVSDTSHIAHWLDWRDAAIQLKPAGKSQTEVTWTLSYVRRLDPAWYFKPWQRYGATLAAGYLIDNLVAPQQVSDKTLSKN